MSSPVEALVSPEEPRSEEKARPRGGRSLPLDVLRAVAVLLVLARHCFPFLRYLQEKIGPERPFSYYVGEVLHRGGWAGVDLFFVLSGFLVSGLLFREYRRYGSVRLGRFLIRRGFKIYPAFYAFIAFAAFVFPGSVNKWRLLAEVFFVQNYFRGIYLHTWSLAVEEHFYLFIACVIYWRLRWDPSPPKGDLSSGAMDFIPKLYVMLGSTMLVARILNLTFFDFSLRTHHFPTLLRMDSLMFGVLLSYFYNFYHDRFVEVCTRYRPALLLGGVALFVPPYVFDQMLSTPMETIGLTGLYLGGGMLVAGLMVGSFPRNAFMVLLGRIGKYSYSIYLWQIPLRRGMELVADRLAEPVAPVAFTLLYALLSVVVGVLTAMAIELPALWLRDRYFPSRSAGAV